MKRFLLVALIIWTFQTPSIAQERKFFDLENSILADIFFNEALEIARSGPNNTRSPQTDPQEVDEFQLLKEAYRADPEATLDLIDRILQAGTKR